MITKNLTKSINYYSNSIRNSIIYTKTKSAYVYDISHLDVNVTFFREMTFIDVV